MERDGGKRLTVGSLFAGIGGLDLGLERAGYEIKWQVENDAWCQKVLTKHWPHVHRYGDIKAIDWSTVEPVDLICGGFPCQPFSLAGKRRGQEDDRYLWPEVVRCLDALRPTWFIGENVPGITSIFLYKSLSPMEGREFATQAEAEAAFSGDREREGESLFCLALDDLERIGYAASQPFAIPACAVDAPHIRQRIWIMAYTAKQLRNRGRESRPAGRHEYTNCGEDVADAIQPQRDRWSDWTCGWEWEPEEALRHARRGGREEAWMSIPESLLGRVAYGLPNRVDRLRGLGNAVVPQIPEIIGRMIMEVNDASTL